jgi:hypothetical protein
MTPIDVYKKLPRSNCGKCPARTCMSFAVQFLRKMISSSECPELDGGAKKEIEAMLPEAGDWKEKRVGELLREISNIKFPVVAGGIGAAIEKDYLKLRYMGRDILLSRSDFKGKVDIWDKLLILMYVKNSGGIPLSGKWVAFRDLKDGLIRAESFHGACEISLARMFEKNKERFIDKLIAMGAEKVSGFSAEHSLVISPLPKIPFLILLRPGDGEFGADCKALLDSTAADFLDVEALLYLGMALVRAMK